MFVPDEAGPDFMACCPAHFDNTPSLSIHEDPDGVLLLYCHAGCKIDAILDAIDLKRHQLFPSPFALRNRDRGLRSAPLRRPSRFHRERDAVVDHARFGALIERYRAGGVDQLRPFAAALHVSAQALDALQAGVVNNAVAFPEFDDERRPVGIGFRGEDGLKGSLRGSRRGLILPVDQGWDAGVLYVAEGPTDTAALLTVGERAIGRPGAKPSAAATTWLIKAIGRASGKVVVVGDNDSTAAKQGVGENAAEALAAAMAARLGRIVHWALPRKGFKDVREQVAAGGWPRGLCVREAQS